MDYSKQSNNKKRMKRKLGRDKVTNSTGIIIFRVIVAVVLITGFAATGALAGAYFGILQDTPPISAPKILPDIYTSYIVDRDMNVITRLDATENRTYVTSDRVSPYFKNAIVAIEDERFFTHNGIDFRGIVRAVRTNLDPESDRVEGASTITQQLVKNNIMGRMRNTLESKIQEQYLAIQYERYLTEKFDGDRRAAKDYILEVYINTVSFGHNINGVQAAANFFFDKDAADLTLSEAAVIAGITQWPSRYVPDRHPEANKRRREMVLDAMLRLEKITQRQYDEAMADDPYERIQQSAHVIARQEGSPHSYFDDQIIETVIEDLAAKFLWSRVEASRYLYNGGLRIVSTQDGNMQQIMDEVFEDDSIFPEGESKIEVQYTVSTRNRITDQLTHHPMRRHMVPSMDDVEPWIESMRDRILGANDEIEAELIIPIPQPQAAMVVIDYRTGEVLAMAGGRGDKQVNRGLNRATASMRQPGSVFKVPAVFAPAIDINYATPATVIDDVPFVTGDGHQFRNWWGSGWRGLNTVRAGVYDSMNVLTVRLMNEVGVDVCFNYLLNFGFTTLVDREEINGRIFSDRTLSAALGGVTRGVTQLEVAAAYGAMANGGVLVPPKYYLRVYDHDGNIILEPNEEPRRVLRAQSAFLLTDMMKDTLTIGTGGQARFRDLRMAVAGKTGTTTDTRDLSFAGYTPYYAASIWLGYDQPATMVDNRTHLRIWRDVMERIHADYEFRDFERPEGIVSASVCRQSGNIPIPGLCDHDPRGSMVRSELFIAGTVPSESCDVHVRVSIDTSTGMIAGPFCPPDYVQSAVRIVRRIPFDGDEFVRDQPYEIRRETLHGPECIYHSHDTIPDGFYFDPETGQLVPITGGDIIPGDSLPTDYPQPTPLPTPTPTSQPAPGTPPPAPTPTAVPTPTPVPEYVPESGFGSATPTPVPTQSPQRQQAPEDNLFDLPM